MQCRNRTIVRRHVGREDGEGAAVTVGGGVGERALFLTCLLGLDRHRRKLIQMDKQRRKPRLASGILQHIPLCICSCWHNTQGNNSSARASTGEHDASHSRRELYRVNHISYMWTQLLLCFIPKVKKNRRSCWVHQPQL